MRIKRKREVTVETAEVFLIKVAIQARCPVCKGWMMTIQEAVASIGANSREIHRRVEAGTVHFAKTEGLLLVCTNSLGKRVPEEDHKTVAFFRKEIRP
jgi:hypothetical protein